LARPLLDMAININGSGFVLFIPKPKIIIWIWLKPKGGIYQLFIILTRFEPECYNLQLFKI
jgi:hypothetical protein